MKNLHLALILIATTGLAALPARALEKPKTQLVDPFASGMWNYHQINLLGDPADIRFDERVRVRAPQAAEDPFHVPIMVDATALADVERIVVSVDYGPIPKILTYYPGEADAKLSFRFKIDQATPVRAAVRTRDGSWHVGGVQVDAAGGGCTAPAAAYASDDWEEHLGEVRGRLWPQTGRLRMIVDHPMDTGLANNIPVFIIENLEVRDEAGTAMARLELHEPVNEDPVFTLHFPPERISGPVRIVGRDNNGNEIDATLQGPLTE